MKKLTLVLLAVLLIGGGGNGFADDKTCTPILKTHKGVSKQGLAMFVSFVDIDCDGQCDYAIWETPENGMFAISKCATAEKAYEDYLKSLQKET